MDLHATKKINGVLTWRGGFSEEVTRELRPEG